MVRASCLQGPALGGRLVAVPGDVHRLVGEDMDGDGLVQGGRRVVRSQPAAEVLAGLQGEPRPVRLVPLVVSPAGLSWRRCPQPPQHPNGAALAVIGHVERAWGYSISTPEAGRQIGAFREAIGGILGGLPVAFAMKGFNRSGSTPPCPPIWSTPLEAIRSGEPSGTINLPMSGLSATMQKATSSLATPLSVSREGDLLPD